MANYLNNINSYADLTAYNADLNKDFPNVSYIQATDEVMMYEYDPEHIVAVYNVTSTSEATTLLYSNSGITYQIIDGVQQSSVQMNYTFDTPGEHTVKYKLTGTSIADNFRSCKALTKVTIPNGVTSIGNHAFRTCRSTNSVIIPNSVTTIGQYAFSDAFATVIIGTGVTSIGNSAFYKVSSSGSIKINSVTLLATTPPTLGSSSFDDSSFVVDKYPIYVPAESVEAYKTASGWSYYADRIQAIPTT